MDELAHELAVSRATLYRAVDGRDRLLGDVLWFLAERSSREPGERSTAAHRRSWRSRAASPKR